MLQKGATGFAAPYTDGTVLGRGWSGPGVQLDAGFAVAVISDSVVLTNADGTFSGTVGTTDFVNDPLPVAHLRVYDEDFGVFGAGYIDSLANRGHLDLWMTPDKQFAYCAAVVGPGSDVFHPSTVHMLWTRQ